MSAEARKIKTLTARRDVEILKLNKLKKVADEALTNPALDNVFKCRHKDIESIRESFAEIHNGIIHYLISQEEANLDPHMVLLKEFDATFYHIQAVFMSLFEKVDNPIASPTPARQNNVKFPKVELPCFDANFKNWQTFIDIFDSLMYNNTTLSNIEKFNKT